MRWKRRNFASSLILRWLWPATVIILAACSPTPKQPNPSSEVQPLVIVPGLEQARVNHKLPAGVTLEEERNGLIVPRSWQFRSERLDHPGLAELRLRERLDEVIAPGRDEFEKMVLLCDWVNSQWKNSNPIPYPPWDANLILSMIRSGQTGGFCAQYAVVLGQSLLSLGWQARYLDIAPEGGKPGSGHFTVEAWSNQHNQWMVLDPFYDCWFEKDKKPLSALQIHEALISGQKNSVRVVRGKGKNAFGNSNASDEQIITAYFSLGADMRNDHLSRPFQFWDRRDTYLAWQDAAAKEEKSVYLNFSADPLEFSFPLNQVQVRLTGGNAPDMLVCWARTNTPELETLELKFNDGPWTRPASPFDQSQGSMLRTALTPLYGAVIVFDWKLAPGDNRVYVRGVNRRGIAGPASFFSVNYQAGKSSP